MISGDQLAGQEQGWELDAVINGGGGQPWGCNFVVANKNIVGGGGQKIEVADKNIGVADKLSKRWRTPGGQV